MLFRVIILPGILVFFGVSIGAGEAPVEYAIFSITTRCDLSCPGCFRVGDGQGDVEFGVFESILRRLSAVGCAYLNISGGEPLLVPEWRKMINSARASAFHVILSTHGAHLCSLDDPALDNLAVLAIPIDGATEETHDRIRGSGHFKHVCDLVNEYQNHDFPFLLKVNTVVREENIAEVERIGTMFTSPNIVWKLFQYAPRGAYSHGGSTDAVDGSRFDSLVTSIKQQNMAGYRIVKLGAAEAGGYILVDPSGIVYTPEPRAYRRICSIFSPDFPDTVRKQVTGNSSFRHNVLGEE